jgi:hypothetical protein
LKNILLKSPILGDLGGECRDTSIFSKSFYSLSETFHQKQEVLRYVQSVLE